MKSEIPVINPDGTVVESREHLVEQLHREAELGTLLVNLYRGPENYGSEAFYTLSDGTVLHEVNGTAGDGSDYHTILMVVEAPGAGLLERLLAKARRLWSPAVRH